MKLCKDKCDIINVYLDSAPVLGLNTLLIFSVLGVTGASYTDAPKSLGISCVIGASLVLMG